MSATEFRARSISRGRIDALRWVRVSTPHDLNESVGADASPVHEMSLEEAAVYLGVEHARDADGDIAPDMEAALAVYSIAWMDVVDDALNG